MVNAGLWFLPDPVYKYLVVIVGVVAPLSYLVVEPVVETMQIINIIQ
jgi:hypothetical protein